MTDQLLKIKSVLDYDPETGVFTWKVRRGSHVHPGDIAGCLLTNGYIQIKVFKKKCLAHRLAWLFVHGETPDAEVDHKNGMRNDNRISNLRKATRAQNKQNERLRASNTSGFKGVTKSRKKWRAVVTANSEQIRLGVYQTPEQAGAVAKAAREKYHGEFANHGEYNE